jgi:hypothetical protein
MDGIIENALGPGRKAVDVDIGRKASCLGYILRTTGFEAWSALRSMAEMEVRISRGTREWFVDDEA